jgi:hypothetical protein
MDIARSEIVQRVAFGVIAHGRVDGVVLEKTQPQMDTDAHR